MQQMFLLQILLLAPDVSGTTLPIIRSSRVLYSGCCLWHFVLWFSSCWSGVELRVMCPVCRMLLHSPTRFHGSPGTTHDSLCNCVFCECRNERFAIRPHSTPTDLTVVVLGDFVCLRSSQLCTKIT